MSYTVVNYKSAAALKRDVAAGVPVRVLPDFIGGTPSGRVWLEGPHAPKPHTWYLEVTVENGLVTKVK